MSVALEVMYNSLLKNEVPVLWKSYPSLKPLGSWVTNIIERVDFVRSWLVEANPKGFWMSGLFYPQGFLTGVKQTHARKMMFEINKLIFTFKCLDYTKDNIPEPPLDGVYVYGLYLEGAKWEKRKKSLVEQLPAELYCEMPVIWFLPMLQEEWAKEKVPKNKPYKCPCYKTTLR